MKKILLSIVAVIAALTAAAQFPYKIIAPLPVDNGTTAYLVNFDSGEKVDSTVIAEGTAVFMGEMDEPFVVRILADGGRFGTFILEQGTTAVNQTTRRAVGSMLNDQYNQFADSVNAIGARYQEAATDEQRQAIMQDYAEFMRQSIEDNLDSPIGYLIFIDYANLVPTEDMLAFVDKHPELKDYRRVQNLMSGAQKKLATSVGKKFVDFSVTYDGKTEKLSDYVGRGQYTLVDFWASWCGPCMREMPNLKDIYQEYHDKGLQIVGVAVWDEPQNSLDAIKRLNLPWPCIINSQTIATDAYGIPAIPCIILFSPDGTILARDVTGADLKAAVAKALSDRTN